MALWTPETRKLAERLARVARQSEMTEFDAHYLIRDVFGRLYEEEMQDWKLRLIKADSYAPSVEAALTLNGHARDRHPSKGVKHMEEGKKRPTKEFRAGPVRASVWIDEMTREDGSTYALGSVIIERRYKDGEEWKSTNRYHLRDLPNLWLVVMECLRFLALREREPNGK